MSANEKPRPTDATPEQYEYWNALDGLPIGTVIVTPRGHRYTKVKNREGDHATSLDWTAEAGRARLKSWELPEGVEIENSVALVERIIRWAREEGKNGFETGLKLGEEQARKKADKSTWAQPLEFKTYPDGLGEAEVVE